MAQISLLAGLSHTSYEYKKELFLLTIKNLDGCMVSCHLNYHTLKVKHLFIRYVILTRGKEDSFSSPNAEKRERYFRAEF